MPAKSFSHSLGMEKSCTPMRASLFRDMARASDVGKMAPKARAVAALVKVLLFILKYRKILLAKLFNHKVHKGGTMVTKIYIYDCLFISFQPFVPYLKFLASGKTFSCATSRTCDLLLNPGGIDLSSGRASVNTGRFSFLAGVSLRNSLEKS